MFFSCVKMIKGNKQSLWTTQNSKGRDDKTKMCEKCVFGKKGEKILKRFSFLKWDNWGGRRDKFYALDPPFHTGITKEGSN